MKLIGVKEITDYVGVSWKTTKNWIYQHGFPAVRLGLWISESELVDEWFKNIVKRKKMPEGENFEPAREKHY
ncbi:MAG: transcriptional regulator [Nitrososphaerota archaeon]